MFENIENIEWDRIRTAENNASGIPSALRGLVSDDPEISESSYWKLDNHIVRQSDLYEAAYYVVPFLLEIVNASLHLGKAYAYDLLYEIANGYAPADQICLHNGIEFTLSDSCRKAVESGVEIYFSEIIDTSSTERRKALELLVSLGKYERSILPRLKELLTTEEDPEFKSLLRESVSELTD